MGHDDSGTPVYVTGNLVPRGGEEGQEALSSKNCEISLMALFGSGDGLWDWNMETNTIYYSPRYIAMLGYDQRRFGHTFESWRDKLHPDERPAVLKRQMDIIMSPRYGDSYEQSFRMLKADGTYCWILSRARVLRRNAHGRATRLIGLHTDITATQGERDRLAEMIEYDSLTDVHSLVYFHNELDRLDRQPDREVSVISCDVNGLKLINDYLGHDTGNSMLQTAARLLRSSLRSTDCVARLGGDEFAVLLPRCNLRDAARVLEKIGEVFRHYNEHSGHVPVIMSFGLSGAEEAPSLREALAPGRPPDAPRKARQPAGFRPCHQGLDRKTQGLRGIPWRRAAMMGEAPDPNTVTVDPREGGQKLLQFLQRRLDFAAVAAAPLDPHGSGPHQRRPGETVRSGGRGRRRAPAPLRPGHEPQEQGCGEPVFPGTGPGAAPAGAGPAPPPSPAAGRGPLGLLQTGRAAHPSRHRA